ncbi:hypothetical protein [Mastigocoleus sp. MO_188.B34]|uniref:hypothetical protein n=1 Tax=Mastigocoleus sp. MO_188.B34 TaxID=3036635 RepID=UPI00261D7FCF|nr:hypothetical protein [Mastigocoleus sp. MO_188.B34]MDJ0695159.1 hypothetical protein [Mastigocoleus sp. MO_188.B34]
MTLRSHYVNACPQDISKKLTIYRSGLSHGQHKYGHCDDRLAKHFRKEIAFTVGAVHPKPLEVGNECVSPIDLMIYKSPNLTM